MGTAARDDEQDEIDAEVADSAAAMAAINSERERHREHELRRCEPGPRDDPPTARPGRLER